MGIILWLIVGAVAGWLAGNIMKGGGLGILGNIVVGMIGSIIGGFILPFLGLIPTNLIGQTLSATAGACILLLLLGVVKRR